MKNIEIRNAAKENGIYLWQLAEAIGMQDSGLSRKLRHELPEQEKNEMLNTIRRIAAQET